MTCELCQTCGCPAKNEGAYQHQSTTCAEPEFRGYMRYRSARAAGLSHADAEALAATTGPMFFTPKATTE